MGAYYPGVPPELVTFIKNEFNINFFVETGTYQGDSAYWASGFFDKVITIELSEHLYNNASKNHANVSNIHFLHGSSSVLLKSVTRVSQRMLFWLDAHWSHGVTAGEGVPCPLLNELEVILASNVEHVILVDDARSLTCQPPAGMTHVSDMPSLVDVCKVLNAFGERYSIIWRDVLVSVPASMGTSVYQFIAQQPDITRIMEANMIHSRIRGLSHPLPKE